MSEQLGSGASGGEAAVGTKSPAGEPLASSSSFVGSARRLSAIRDTLGEGALRLAYHAAIPVVMDADLLNLLRVNFFLDDPPDVLPFEVEAELLLSPLFREIGEGLYEIDPGLRNLLLSGLQTRYGNERVRRVAALLEQYTDAAAAWRSLPDLELAQQLTALSFLDPAAAERWLDEHEAGAARPSSSSASSADDGPGREWYVAMRRRIAENSDITTIDTEIRYAGEALLQLLSDGHISARLSVIRSLESLASLPDTDADEVVNVLCAFIQNWDERSPGPSKRVTLDVQAALSLIGSLPHIEFRLEGVALTGANLAGLDLSYAIFDRVMLSELDARGLDLTYAQFSDVILSDANLDGAFLDEAFLEFRTLRQVSLKGVSREGAYIAADTIQDVTGSRADDAALEIHSLSAADETIGFSAALGLEEEPAGEATEEELLESGSPDESSVVQDSHERLWRVAKETAWIERPNKFDLGSLAAVLPPEERLIGICELPLRFMRSICVFTITDRTLYLSAGQEHKHWKNLRDSAPERFRVGELVLGVPLTEVETCTITDDFFVLQIRNEPQIEFHVSQASSFKPLVDNFFNTARRGMQS